MRHFLNFALWVIISLLLAVSTVFENPVRAASSDISFSQLLSEVDQGRVRSVVIQGQEIRGTFTDGHEFQTYAPIDPNLVLYQKNIDITVRPRDAPWIVQLLFSWLLILAMDGVWIFMSRQMRGTGGKASDFGNRARRANPGLGAFPLWVMIILLLATMFMLFQNPTQSPLNWGS